VAARVIKKGVGGSLRGGKGFMRGGRGTGLQGAFGVPPLDALKLWGRTSSGFSGTSTGEYSKGANYKEKGRRQPDPEVIELPI